MQPLTKTHLKDTAFLAAAWCVLIPVIYFGYAFATNDKITIDVGDYIFGVIMYLMGGFAVVTRTKEAPYE